MDKPHINNEALPISNIKDGKDIIILLAGGTKKRQQNDITLAQKRWKDHKRRKRLEK